MKIRPEHNQTGSRALPAPTIGDDGSILVEFATDTPARMRVGWDEFVSETLVCESESVIARRLELGNFPLLSVHYADGGGRVETLIGQYIPNTFTVGGGKCAARFALSETEGDAETVAKIKSGILKGASVGYFRRTVEVTAVAGGDDIWRVTQWEPYEVTIAAVVADPACGVRTIDKTPQSSTRASALKQEPKSQGDKMKLKTSERFALLTGAGIDIASDDGKRILDIDDDQVMRTAVCDAMVSRQAQAMPAPNPRITDTASEGERRLTAITKAIDARVTGARVPDDLAGLSLLGAVRTVYGIGGNVSDSQLLGMCGIGQRSPGPMTTFDLPNVLGSALDKSVMTALAKPVDYESWTGKKNAKSFKGRTLVRLTDLSGLATVAEAEDYPVVSLADKGVTISPDKGGCIVAITFESIINDDLGFLQEIPTKAVDAAKRRRYARALDLLTANPTLDDGLAIFHADRGNIGTAYAPGVSALADIFAKMSAHTDDGGTELGIECAFVHSPVAKAAEWDQILNGQFVAATAATAKPTFIRPALKVHSRLDASSQQIWYASASPDLWDGLVFCAVEGKEIDTRTWEDPESDSVMYRIRDTAAPAMVEPRAWYRNPGA